MKIEWKHTALFYTILLTLLFLAICCSNTFAAPLSNSEAEKVIENQRDKYYNNYGGVRVGKIGIQTRMRSALEEQKEYLGKKGDLFKYTTKYRKKLDAWVKCGVIQISEEYFNSDRILERNMEIMNDGHKYIVSLTDEGNRLLSQKSEDFAFFNVGKIKVTKLVKNTEIKNTAKYGTKEVRLVMGIYDFIPTELGVKYYSAIGEVLHKQYKFRVLLEYDLFKETWSFAAFDLGLLDTGQWVTNNVKE